MLKKRLRIVEAIEYYNWANTPEKKFKQQDLAVIVMPDSDPKTAGIYLSNWNKGNRLGTLKIEHIHSICETTGVDANFLYGISEMK